MLGKIDMKTSYNYVELEVEKCLAKCHTSIIELTMRRTLEHMKIKHIFNHLTQTEGSTKSLISTCIALNHFLLAVCCRLIHIFMLHTCSRYPRSMNSFVHSLPWMKLIKNNNEFKFTDRQSINYIQCANASLFNK